MSRRNAKKATRRFKKYRASHYEVRHPKKARRRVMKGFRKYGWGF